MQSANARYWLRAGITTTLAVLAALTTALVDGGITAVEVITVASTGVGALGTYLGVGQLSGSVEPNVGRELESGEGLARRGVG